MLGVQLLGESRAAQSAGQPISGKDNLDDGRATNYFSKNTVYIQKGKNMFIKIAV